MLCPELISPRVKPRTGGASEPGKGLWSPEVLLDQALPRDISDLGWVSVPKLSSAICVADALKEGGLGLACFELKLAAPPGSSQGRVEPLLSLPGCSPPPPPLPHPGFCAELSSYPLSSLFPSGAVLLPLRSLWLRRLLALLLG